MSRRVVFGTICVVFALSVVYKNFTNLKTVVVLGAQQQQDVKPCLKELIEKAKVCLMEAQSRSKSTEWMNPAINKCAANFTKSLQLKPLDNKEELKYVILPVDVKGASCTSVSLGIGGNIEAEKLLKGLQPACKFYGADPIYKSGILFEELGKYVQTAVSDKKGNFVASVLENGNYIDKTVSYISLEEFFKLNGITFVDYLIIDAEGAEYPLIPLFEKANLQKMRDGQGIPICQVNIELHLPLERYGTNNGDFNKIFQKLFLTSDFLPLVSSVLPPHLRTMWIDASNPKCVSKYFPNIC